MAVAEDGVAMKARTSVAVVVVTVVLYYHYYH